MAIMDIERTVYPSLGIGLHGPRLDGAGAAGRTLALPDSDGTLAVLPGGGMAGQVLQLGGDGLLHWGTVTTEPPVPPVVAHWDPIMAAAAGLSLSDHYRVLDLAAGPGGLVRAVMAVIAGRWYWEMVVGSDVDDVGIATLHAGATDRLGFDGESHGINGTAGSTIGLALDMDTGRLWASHDGAWTQYGSPDEQFSSPILIPAEEAWWPAVHKAALGPLTARFAAADWAYPAPTGYLPLQSDHL